MAFKIIPLCIAFFLFSGCAPKTFEHKFSAHITLKTQKLRHSDMGFIYRDKSYVKAQIYKFGAPVFTLRMHGNICIENACYTYERFNETFLHPSYPKGLIRNVFSAKAIFNGKNLVTTKEGFEQKLQSSTYEIFYEVSKDLIRLHDKKNSIIIQIKNISGG
jgi:hypothetical protein